MARKSKHKRLLEFYTEILADLCVHEVEDGSLAAVYGDFTHPCLINELPLVLPSHEVLKSSEWDKHIPFHPLSESYVKGESEVIHLLHKLFRAKIHMAIVTLLNTICKVAVDQDIQKSATITTELAELGSIDIKTGTVLSKVLDAALVNEKSELIRIYLNREGKLGDTSYKRICRVTFPILTDLESDTQEILGVKMRKRDKTVIKELFEMVLPNMFKVDGYTVGTDTNFAPNFTVLLKALYGVAKDIHKVAYIFRKHLDDNLAMSKLEWSEIVLDEDLSVFKDIIPQLPCNIGITTNEDLVEKPKKVRPPKPSAATPKNQRVIDRDARRLERSQITSDLIDDTPPPARTDATEMIREQNRQRSDVCVSRPSITAESWNNYVDEREGAPRRKATGWNARSEEPIHGYRRDRYSRDDNYRHRQRGYNPRGYRSERELSPRERVTRGYNRDYDRGYRGRL